MGHGQRSRSCRHPARVSFARGWREGTGIGRQGAWPSGDPPPPRDQAPRIPGLVWCESCPRDNTRNLVWMAASGGRVPSRRWLRGPERHDPRGSRDAPTRRPGRAVRHCRWLRRRARATRQAGSANRCYRCGGCCAKPEPPRRAPPDNAAVGNRVNRGPTPYDQHRCSPSVSYRVERMVPAASRAGMVR